MNIKTYKFSYGGVLKKLISKTVSLLYNSMIGGFALLLFMIAAAEINYGLKFIINETIINILQ